MQDEVSLAETLVSSVGVAGARAASVLAGEAWRECVALVPAFTQSRWRKSVVKSAPSSESGAHDAGVPAATGRRIRIALTFEGAVSLRELERVDLLVVDLLPRGAKRGDGSLLLLTLIDLMPVGASIVMAVPTGWLHSASSLDERRGLLDRCDLRTVLSLGRPHAPRNDRAVRTGALSMHLAVTLLHLHRVADSTKTATYFASLPSGAGPTAPTVERFLTALRDPRPAQGNRTEWGFAASVSGLDVWDPAWLRPERQELVEDLFARGAAVAINEIAEVFRGRRPPRKASGKSIRILQAKDIAADLPSAEDLELMNKGPITMALTLLQPGDVVGSISGPTGRWAIVPDDYDEVYAGDHTVVLRLRAAVPVSARYLLAWLRSRTAEPLFVTRGSVISRLDLNELSAMPVPVAGNGAPNADAQLAQVDEAKEILGAQLDALVSAEAAVFDGIHPADVGRRIAEVSGLAATTIAGLRRHEDLLRRVQDLYPYPVARNVRALRLARNARAVYDEILNTFESLLYYLAVVAAVWARRTGVVTRELDMWRTKIYEGGASLGLWLGVARSMADAAHALGDDVAGFAPAMAATERTSLRRALDAMLTERNKTHGNRPQSDHAYQVRVAECRPTLELALDASAFLVRSELLWVEDVRPIETMGDPMFEVTVERAMGDRPDWDVDVQILPDIVFDQRFYLASDGAFLPASPFLLAMRCSECHQRHVYYPDKLASHRANLNSIDRGHPRIDSDSRLVAALMTAIPKPQSNEAAGPT